MKRRDTRYQESDGVFQFMLERKREKERELSGMDEAYTLVKLMKVFN